MAAKPQVVGYRAWMKAGKGFLLGGVKVWTSSTFELKRDAESLRQTSVKINRDAGRDVASSGVRRVVRSKSKK